MKRAMFLAVLVCLGILLVTGQEAKEAAPQDSKGLVLSYSTYLGGSGVDDCDALAVDGSGNVYLACHSTSTDFPTADSAHYANRGEFDAFVVKLNPSGSEVIYVAHFGGSKWEAGNGITVDAAGNAYVVGSTYSPDFPTTEGAFQTTFGGQQDVFVTKLDSSGSVVYTTYLGGSGEDLSYGIAIDDLGNVYVAGMTESPDFPTANPFQPALGGGRDAFVAKLTPSGTALVYSTYLGGSGNEGRWGARIAVDAAGNAYVAGGTESADFPTVNPLQAALAGKQDTFVAKLNPTGSALVYSTYLGGSGEEEDSDLVIDASGNVYVAGGTESPDFPTAKAWQKVLGGGQDAFVAKLNPTGSALVYSTYLGGKGKDFANSIAVGAAGHAYVTGGSDSTNFPTAKPVQGAFAGGEFDAFVTKFNSAGSALVYSTYLGGSGRDLYERIALDPAGNAYVAGLTNSPDFPTANPIQGAYGGGVFDVMVAKFSEASAAVARRVAEIRDLTGSVSPDGRFLAYTDWRTGDLAVRDLKTGEDRHLTNKGSWLESEEYALYSTVSPDGKQIAYGWFNQEGFFDLRVIGVDGSGARVLYRNQEIPGCQPHDWSPDGRHILAGFRRKDRTHQIVLVSVADGSVQELKTLDWRSPFMMSFSPDGRFIAYDFPPQEDSPDRDIFLLATDGSREIPLVEHPANDLVLGWAPDGKQFLFASDRTGSQRAWLIEVADGKHLGEPKLVKPEISPFRGLGFTRDGSYYYCCGVPGGPALNDVYLVTLDPATHKLQAPKKLVSGVGVATSIDWSPDGQYLAYNKEGGWAPVPPYRFVLVVRSVESGKERRLRLNIRRSGAFQPHWSPDGRFLLAQAEDHTGGRGVYRIDAQTGEVTPIVQSPRCCIEWPVWARDGKVIFTRWTGGEPQSIVARDLESGREEELYRVVSPVSVSHLAASPDGQWLAFVWSGTEKGPTALKVMPAAGGEPRELVKLPEPRRSTFGTPVFELAWTPDSCHIIYALSIAGQKQEFEIWRISLEGGQPQRLGPAMGGLWPFGLSVHPDGRQIAFTAGPPRLSDPIWVLENFLPPPKDEQTGPRQRKITFDLTGEDGYAQIYVVNQDGSGLQQLTDVIGKDEGDVKGNQLPVWSPDRKKIAFVSTRDRTWEVYVMNADGLNQQRLTYTTKGQGNSSPAWSPDGKKIVFNSVRDGNPEIYVMSADGSNVRRLTHDQGEDASPDWAPDGRKIAFYSTRDGNREIYVMEGDGSNLRRLTHHQGDDAVPHWSPDGRRIVFQSNRHGGSMSHEGEEYEIYVMDADGSNVQRLTHTPGRDKRSWSPAWSPDGKRIVFHSNRDGTSTFPPTKNEGKPIPLWKRENWFEYEIYVIDADGSNIRRLTFNKKIDLHPDW